MTGAIHSLVGAARSCALGVWRVEGSTEGSAGAEWKEDGPKVVRQIQSVQLFDVGPVTYPAYEATSAVA